MEQQRRLSLEERRGKAKRLKNKSGREGWDEKKNGRGYGGLCLRDDGRARQSRRLMRRIAKLTISGGGRFCRVRVMRARGHKTDVAGQKANRDETTEPNHN
jgi:hypothetical protein